MTWLILLSYLATFAAGAGACWLIDRHLIARLRADLDYETHVLGALALGDHRPQDELEGWR